MIVIGIVGVPAGGKSTVAARLRELGSTWIDADRLAKKCLDRAQVAAALQRRFGPAPRDAEGRIDRRWLAEQVFGDDDASRQRLNYLESVLHPHARHLALRRLQRSTLRGCVAATLDAPLLLEADWGVLCDYVWCVDAPRDLRLRWLASRGWSAAELVRRERRQLGIAEKRRLSTDLIENRGDLHQLRRVVDRLWSERVQHAYRGADVRLDAGPAHCAQYPLTLPSRLPSPGPPGTSLF
jgi:dephospho-CoA kinase